MRTTMPDADARLLRQIDRHPYRLVFVTISGAHLYGFPSPDSDFDLRGVHTLPLQSVLGLETQHDCVDCSYVDEGLEIDLVTHDAREFFLLMLNKNGPVLEQVFSPLVVQTTPWHEEVKALAAGCITRHHAWHYLGFAHNQWSMFLNSDPPRVKPLLYTFRVLLTGIHLMHTGQVEANLVQLNEEARLPYLPELIDRKLAGPEAGTLVAAETTFYKAEYQRLHAALEAARDASGLPEHPSSKAGLSDLLVRLRLESH